MLPLEKHKEFGFCWFCFIEVELIYNVVLMSAVRQSDSVIHIYIYAFFFVFFFTMAYLRILNMVLRDVE